MSRPRILAIETSCDETAAAVVDDELTVISSVVSSQIDLHAAFGGVVPEVASRAHMEAILPVIAEALLASTKLETRNTKQIQNSKSLNIKNLDLDIVSNFDIRYSNFQKERRFL